MPYLVVSQQYNSRSTSSDTKDVDSSGLNVPLLRSQIRGIQLLDAVRFDKVGYPERMPFGEFKRRFACLAPMDGQNPQQMLDDRQVNCISLFLLLVRSSQRHLISDCPKHDPKNGIWSRNVSAWLQSNILAIGSFVSPRRKTWRKIVLHYCWLASLWSVVFDQKIYGQAKGMICRDSQEIFRCLAVALDLLSSVFFVDHFKVFRFL